MRSSTLTPQQQTAVLSAYAPYGVMVQFPTEGTNTLTGRVEFFDYSVEPPYVSILHDSPSRRMAPVDCVLPVLYSLADLPQLPGDPLPRLVQLLDILLTQDRGAGEWVRAVRVVSASPMQLHLGVITGYTPSYEVNEEDDHHMEDDGEEPDDEPHDTDYYEVIIGGRGDIHWRCLNYEQGKREGFRLLGGAEVLLAVEYLRQLHVAVGEVVHIGEVRYVRKSLPVQQEGGGDGWPPYVKCRVCGCTNDDCSQCIEATGEPCSWAGTHLCSRCQAEQEGGADA